MNIHIEIPAGPFDGYIFDCDGTLAHTMPMHYRAWLTAFADKKAPFEFSEEYFYSLGGTPTTRIVEILNEKHGTAFDAPALAHYKEDKFEELMHEITPIDEVVACARRFKAEGKPVAVASGGMRHIVEKTLDSIGLGGFFPIVITPEQVNRGKPFPDMFLLAAEKMGTTPARTLVFEDAVPGIDAAKAAGMQYVVVPRPASCQ
jgi:HAD superfamily hydrolase (TIGR01509 family)